MRTALLVTNLIFTVQIAAQSFEAVILLAGESKRLGTKISKMLTPIADDKPIAWYPIHAAQELNLPTTLVIGHQKDEVRNMVLKYFEHAPVTFAVQDKQLGTGHALQCTKQYWKADNILVLNGDHPTTNAYTLSKLIQAHEQSNADITILIAHAIDNKDWGRIVYKDSKPYIVEAVDFKEDRSLHPYVNAGYYIFKRTFLEEHIDKLWLHTNKKEFYVTDLIELAHHHNVNIQCVEASFDDVFGVNTQEELKYAEQLLQKRLQPLPQHIFKEYNIRGIVDQEIQITSMYALGKSLAYFFKNKQAHTQTVAVGMDGRIHSAAIKDHLIAGLRDSGLDVIFVGLCPSPGLYFATHTLPVDAGIMITASHNPKEYNGLKICLGTEHIWGKEIQELYDCYMQQKQLPVTQRGSYSEHAIVPEYVAWLAHEFNHLRSMKLSAIIDCGNGAGGAVIPSLIEAMGWQQVKTLYTDVDGTYPHHEADLVHMKNMEDLKDALVKSGYDIGIGLDGDADRMAPLTSSGTLVSGDLLLGLYVQAVIDKHEQVGVVFDVKTSSALINYLNSIGAQPHMSRTGHVLVKSLMKETGALLAGEVSCHFCFKDRYFGYDDGIYAMLRLFELLEQRQESLDALLRIYPAMYTTPEFRIPCDNHDRNEIIDTVASFFSKKQNAELLTIDGVRVTLPYGWGLLRASNTEPVLSMRFESATLDGLERIKNDFSIAMRNHVNRTQLRKRLIH